MAERLLLDRPERTLLVRDLAPVADHQVEGEEPDDPVDERSRDEAGAREHGEGGVRTNRSPHERALRSGATESV